jgi:hypothetical protein
MFPPAQFHQEVARQRHADLLREARREQLASLLTAERERSPIVRLRRLVGAGLLEPLRRREAHARRPGSRVVEFSP